MLALLFAFMSPPVAFDHPPVRDYALHYVAPDEIARRCRGLDLMVAQLRDPLARALGCTDLGTMTIWIDTTLPPVLRDEVLRHELAHVNGWRHH